MPTTVDSLDIQISAESKKASAAINDLVKKLDRVSASLSGVNSRGLATMASGVNKLSNAMANFSKNTKTADFSRITRNLNKLGEINPNSIAVASKSLGKIAGAMKAFDGINVSDNAAKLAELSKGISTLGYKSAEKALENIPKLATAMRSFMKTLSTAPKVSQNIIDMTNAMARFARTGASGGKAANELANSMSNMSRKFASIPSVFKKVNVSMSSSVLSLKNLKQALASAIGTFGGIYAVFEGLKKSIDISSDLTEVQNVVDVTFGKYSKAIEDFTKVSIKDFGMSELTAKTMAGRFQAMGTAIGFSQKKMSGMSVELTKLAADMSSFYNVEQDAVATSLQAVFTGETEPLRKYGLDLTQVTLEEWAHKQGIDAKMKSMSQAEKTMLRYQYVMANTGAAQGDFARTANTWANQIRLLKQNFEVLGSTIGGVLINTLKPFVQGLNVIMGQINNFAKIISNALGKIFGWTYEEGGGAINPAEEMSNGMDDVADSTDKATKAQKEYNRQLGKFDELNNYNKQKNNNTTGGDGKGNGITMPSSVGTSTGKWTQGESILKEYESEIDSLYELGQTISDALKTAMERIDWDGIYKKAENFGTGLADFLNGLISPDLFNALGETVAGTLNTALHFLDSFGEKFEWENFGESLAEGLNSYIKKFDWELSAKTFNTLTSGILDAAISAAKKVKWKRLRDSVFSAINGIDFPKIGWKLGKLVDSLSNAVYTLVSDKKAWSNLGSNIATGINKFFKANNWETTGKAIGGSIVGIITAIKTALETLSWSEIGSAIGSLISGINFGEIVWDLGSLAVSLISGIGKALIGSMSKAPIETGIAMVIASVKVKNIIENSETLNNIGNISSGIITKIGEKILGKTISLSSLKIAASTTFSVIGIGAVVGIVAGAFLKSWSEKNIDVDLANINLNSEAIENARTKIKQSLSDLSIKLENIDLDYEDKAAELDSLSKRFWDLSQKTSLTKVESKSLKEIYGKLVQEMPELKGQVDDQTKAYKGTKEQLDELTKKTKKYYLLQAGEEKLAAIAKTMFKAQTNLNKAKTAYGKTLAKIQKYNEKIKELDEQIAYYTNISYDEDKINDLSKEMGKYETQLKNANAELKNQSASLNKAQKDYDSINKKYNDTNKELEEMSGNLDNVSKKNATPKISINSDANEKIKEINDKIDELEQKKKQIKLSGDNEDAKNKIDAIDKKIDNLKAKKKEIKLTGNNEDAKSKIKTIDEKIDALEEKKKEIKLTGDNADAKKKIKDINDKISKLNKKKAKIEVDVDVSWNQKYGGKTIKSSIPQNVQDWIVSQKYDKKAMGGIFKNGKWQNIAKYASGGLPNIGQMFIARESGPELVGNLGGNTAVMNNDQIVSSVSDGVYRAVLAAMSNFSYNNRNSQGDIVVQIDGKEIFRAVRNEDSDFKKRTGRSAFSY